MKIIALFNLKDGVTSAKLAETISRRMEFKFPEGLELLAEYWTPVAAPAVIGIFEASDPAAIMANSASWIDVFNVGAILPITDWQEGGKKLGKLLKKV